ncbi:MAG: WD40-repeat-containing domain protein [Benjaminiella poitrasii]|nr:MAG: WD40-repeat-containing domain protein [Benjaminiella poitrasii]
MDVLPTQRQPPTSTKSTTSSSLGAGVNRDQQVEKLLKEVKQLKQKVDVLDKENIALKKSIYDLSARYAASISQGGLSYRPGPFVIDNEPTNNKAQEMITKVVQEAGGDVEPFQSIYPHDSRDGKPFQMRYELKGHTGAVYTVEFSPNGALLASGSFDKTIRIWDTASAQKELFCLKGHTLNISDLAWTSDSSTLLSGAFDETCKTWDVENGKLLKSYDTEGLVQCVGWDFLDSNIFYYGTSRKVLAMVDIRSEENESIIIRNDAMINTLYASRDGIHVLTGDAAGMLKVWDVRSRQCISSKLNDPSKMSITHITIGRRSTDASRRAIDDYDEPRYMALNSYDNLLRVYDRGMDPPKSDLRLVHTLKGFKNKNWPIKSSFYCGSGYNSSILSKPPITNDIYADSDLISNNPGDYLFDTQEPKEEKSVLLATGSADPYAYLYNVGEDSAELMQCLEGHTDRVYAVNFHPTEPILASCSADFTVKIWGPSLHRGKKKTTIN